MLEGEGDIPHDETSRQRQPAASVPMPVLAISADYPSRDSVSAITLDDSTRNPTISTKLYFEPRRDILQ